MTKSLSITSGLNSVRVFRCPSCKQTIDTSSLQCRFCSATVDAVEVEQAVIQMAKVSQACNDASYLKITAISMLAFLGAMFIPFIGLAGLVGYWFLSIAIPVLAVRWWIKFGRLRTEDEDFPRARRIVVIVSILFLLPLGWDVLRIFGI